MSDHDPKPRLDGFSVTYALTLLPPVGWWVYWYLFGRGDDGCGPPGESAAGLIFYLVLLGLPVATAGIAVAFGGARRWRPSALIGAALITVIAGGLFELFVFF